MARRKPDDDQDLVPYYRPGTTEPEMVPRSSVPGYVDPGTEENESADDEGDDASRALDSAEGREVRPSTVKKATKKVARKK